jgi:hypothetical protein
LRAYWIKELALDLDVALRIFALLDMLVLDMSNVSL